MEFIKTIFLWKIQNSDIFYFNKIITHLNMSMVKTHDKNIFQSGKRKVNVC